MRTVEPFRKSDQLGFHQGFRVRFGLTGVNSDQQCLDAAATHAAYLRRLDRSARFYGCSGLEQTDARYDCLPSTPVIPRRGSLVIGKTVARRITRGGRELDVFARHLVARVLGHS